MINTFTAPSLSTSASQYDVKHGFLGRKGGHSVGLYAGLNTGLGSDDDRDAILKNRKIAADAIMANAALHSVHQIHSNRAVLASSETAYDGSGDDKRPQADALVTDKANLLLSVLTADCVPVLFADHEAGVIGAAHAGWKGAITGVTDNVIAMMESLGAVRDHIICAVGPCISQKSYEVDSSFKNRFTDDERDNDHFFKDGKTGHFQFDIEAYVASRLAKAGIKNINCLGQDTYSQEDEFYSYRRSCHNKKDGYGRQISIIGMQARS